MPINPISSGGITPIEFPKLTKTTGSSQKDESDFGSKLTGALENLQQTQKNSDSLAVQAATGDLNNIHDYLIAANQAELTTQLTVAVKNKAVESFQQIMSMQV